MPKKKCALRKGVTKWPILEESIANWVLENHQNGLIVTRNSVRLFALRWSKKNANESKNFKATFSWCSRFMARNNLVLREKTKVSQLLPKEVDNKFQMYIIGFRKQKKYLLSHIGNMDETPVTFGMIGNKTIDMKGTKTIHKKTTRHKKSHFTVVLSCLADDTKLKPMVIFKRKTVPKSNFTKSIFIHVHDKGWMDENGVKLWIKNIWQRHPGVIRNLQSLLVWDMFRSYLTDNTKKLLTECNTDIAVIPGGLKSLVQPLDVCINKPFKQNLKRQWKIHGC
ncbi:pogo transposable element with KRAB domain [Trichonephila clavipes]|nr:pogo transposable element with KRAB domain [Trichonephila clavipes]